MLMCPCTLFEGAEKTSLVSHCLCTSFNSLLKSDGMVYYVNSLEPYLICDGCLTEHVKFNWHDFSSLISFGMHV